MIFRRCMFYIQKVLIKILVWIDILANALLFNDCFNIFSKRISFSPQNQHIVYQMLINYIKEFFKISMQNQRKKVIVFDVDGTLLHRTMTKIQNIAHDYSSNGRYIYVRPNLNHLALHIPILSQKAQFVIWTSMLRKNAQKIHNFLDGVGLKFDRLYSQQQCRQQDLAKDLNVIAQDMNINVKDIYLIDDSPHKRIDNQNFIKIQEFNGEKRDDKQIIRIIKELYKLVDLPYAERSIEDVADYDIINKLKKLKVSQPSQIQKKGNHNNNKNMGKKQKKQKKQKIQTAQKQNNIEYREKLPTKYKQKVEQANEQINEQVEQPQIHKKPSKNKQNLKNNPLVSMPLVSLPPAQIPKLNPNTKVIVFDLNKTLIIKRKQQQPSLSTYKNPQKIQGNIIYNRPHIDILRTLVQCHPLLQIKYMVWSTMTGKSVINHCKQVVQKLPVQFSAVINGVQNQDHPGKDLREICEKYDCQIDNVMLVDDSQYKRVNGQNFYNIRQYTGDIMDVQMIRVAREIDQFIGCQDQNCVVKHVVSQYNQYLIAADLKYKQHMAKQQQQKLNNNHQQAHNLVNAQQKVHTHLVKTPQIQCIVFDINETLLTRYHKQIDNVPCDDKNHHYFFYSRPHLLELNQFLKCKNIRCCLWSTIKAHNCQILKKILRKKGFQFQMLFSGEDLEHGKKNLETVAKQLNIPVDNIVLVDDNPKKRIQNQSYIQISSFDPENQQDDALLHLIQQLTRILDHIK